MFIDRHSVDQEFAKSLFDESVSDLPFVLKAARQDPASLVLLLDKVFRIVCAGSVISPQSPDVAAALKLAGEAQVALCVAGTSDSASVTVRLDGDLITYHSKPSKSSVHVRQWIDGFYINFLLHDIKSLDLLCSIPTQSFSAWGTPDYFFLYADVLRGLRLGKGDIGTTLVEAVKATDPSRPDVYDKEGTLWIDVPQLEILTSIIARGADINNVLRKSIELHKAYWTKTKLRRRSYRGFISLDLTALVLMAQEQGFVFAVESPYLAPYLSMV